MTKERDEGIGSVEEKLKFIQEANNIRTVNGLLLRVFDFSQGFIFQ